MRLSTRIRRIVVGGSLLLFVAIFAAIAAYGEPTGGKGEPTGEKTASSDDPGPSPAADAGERGPSIPVASAQPEADRRTTSLVRIFDHDEDDEDDEDDRSHRLAPRPALSAAPTDAPSRTPAPNASRTVRTRVS
ncbi:hypothetical protein AB1399_01070 [Hydrogenibacillus schlegelii]|uniref:Uncharacterized protein n=1 Tax=Hydrogenibacillus schlegelii TaxID=1484 RepID=A0A132NAB9_HYDSH|nr:hypothetical protein [Hydrogenibacillus schlegelii]KWX07099.1 hypothetical protein TR75_04000 [Hydrogenibacillus schlegelii]OAR05448.1 hypothetical protein SA87_11185 [Hydrogenibacillus schlegelii]PTQ54334.1 MAG: hypothetical protein HSCHL_0253 [Hydrogenibacillus schlegelii]